MKKEPFKIHRPGGFPVVIAEAGYSELYIRRVAEEAGLVVGKTVRYVCNCPAGAWVFQISGLSEDAVEQLMLRLASTESCHFGY